jgi:excisionase family DNA binding protein
MADLVKAARIAERLDVSPATVYRMAARGELPSVMIADRVLRFDPDAIDAWIAARSVSVNPQRADLHAVEEQR